MVSKRFLKKKDNKKSFNKNSIKVTNKQQNKLNKGKKRKVEDNKLKRTLKQAKKVNYFLLIFFSLIKINICNTKKDGKINNKDNENSDDEQLRKDNTYFSHVNNKHVDYEGNGHNNSEQDELKRRGNKRKKFSNETENDVEFKYKPKEANNKNSMMSKGKKAIQLALPIKTQSGHLLKNIREEEDDQNENIVEKATKPVIQEASQVKTEKPKSYLEQLKEKQDNFNKTKDKVAYFSRDIIENPQREVFASFFFILAYCNASFLVSRTKCQKNFFWHLERGLKCFF